MPVRFQQDMTMRSVLQNGSWFYFREHGKRPPWQQEEIIRARICKSFKEPINRFPAWRKWFLQIRALVPLWYRARICKSFKEHLNRFLGSLNVYKYELRLHGRDILLHLIFVHLFYSHKVYILMFIIQEEGTRILYPHLCWWNLPAGKKSHSLLFYNLKHIFIFLLYHKSQNYY